MLIIRINELMQSEETLVQTGLIILVIISSISTTNTLLEYRRLHWQGR